MHHDVPHNMPIESKTEDLNWTRLEGMMLGGVYTLERFASADASSASFDTHTGGERPARAVARLAKIEGESGERRLQIWQALKKSGHPNLLPIWATGRTQAEGQDLIYAVVEAADENLAGVLAERVLEPAEVGEILVSLVGALGHLHSHGFVHGSVSPEQVFAVGETVKLSTGGVQKIGVPAELEIHRAKYRAPESVWGNITPPADIWCLGATLVEALTQKACGDNCLAEAKTLPRPFNEIAGSCLQPGPEARGSLTHILNLYEGKAGETLEPAAAPKRMVAEAGTGGSTAPADSAEAVTAGPEAEPVPVVPVYLAPGPVVPGAEAFSTEAFSATEEAPVEEAQRPVEWRDTAAAHSRAHADELPDASERVKRRAWAFVAVALAILFAVVIVLRPRPANDHAANVAQQGTATKQPATGHGQTMTLPAANQNGAPAVPKTSNRLSATHNAAAASAGQLKPTVSSAATAAHSGPIWRVILYTYNRAADAEKRAAIINSKHPELHAEVFMPNGAGKGPYLVSLGGTTDRQTAAQRRRTAVRAGLPRDSYLQNYSR